MRRDNRELKRYRLDPEVLFERLMENLPAVITDLNIQAGEDPVAVREVAIPLVQMLKARTPLGISVCLGTLRPQDYEELRRAGAEFYIMKIETGDPEHYREIQAPGTLDERLEAIHHLAATGWRVSSGFIAGLPGESGGRLWNTISLMDSLPLDGWSVSPFIAGEQTPHARAACGGLDATLNCLAAMRLLRPSRVIPAVSAMKILGSDGYAAAIRSGANLATINLTPDNVRAGYPLYTRGRLIMAEENILHEIALAGCEPSPTGLAEFLRSRPNCFADPALES